MIFAARFAWRSWELSQVQVPRHSSILTLVAVKIIIHSARGSYLTRCTRGSGRRSVQRRWLFTSKLEPACHCNASLQRTDKSHATQVYCERQRLLVTSLHHHGLLHRRPELPSLYKAHRVHHCAVVLFLMLAAFWHKDLNACASDKMPNVPVLLDMIVPNERPRLDHDRCSCVLALFSWFAILQCVAMCGDVRPLVRSLADANESALVA